MNVSFKYFIFAGVIAWLALTPFAFAGVYVPPVTIPRPIPQPIIIVPAPQVIIVQPANPCGPISKHFHKDQCGVK